MAYTISQFNTECKNKAIAVPATYYEYAVEKINMTHGTKVIFMLVNSVRNIRGGETFLNVTFFYFLEWTSIETRSENEMISAINTEMKNYLNTVFSKANQANFWINDGQPFVITNIGGIKDKDYMMSCSCTVELYLKC